jgi:hypothetical protein
MATLKGHYKMIDANIYQSENGLKLIVSRRKNARVGLASHFLLKVDDKGQREYLSSLYRVDDYTYNIEVNRHRYQVKLSDDALMIEC